MGGILEESFYEPILLELLWKQKNEILPLTVCVLGWSVLRIDEAYAQLKSFGLWNYCSRGEGWGVDGAWSCEGSLGPEASVNGQRREEVKHKDISSYIFD